MKNVFDQIASLPAEKRALLELLLKKQGIDVKRAVILPRPPGMNRVPLSFGQQRLWFIEQLEPGGSAYNVPSSIWLDPQTDLQALAASLNATIRRHESLRTVFEEDSGEPVQVIQPSYPAPLPLVDLSELDSTRAEAESARVKSEEINQGFDLKTGPLLRALVIRLAPARQMLTLTMHHIISDGWSMGVLVRDVKNHYEAMVKGVTPRMDELKIQYADYAIWQREIIEDESSGSDLSYWDEHLRDAPRVIELPLDRPRSAGMNRLGGEVLFELDDELSAGLRRLSRQAGATLYMTMMAALKALLSRMSGQRHIVLGTPVAGRDRLETEGMIGFFVNTLALRTEIIGSEGFSALLQRVRSVVIEGQTHQNVPFEKVVERLQPERGLNHTPLFQVMFAFNNNEDWEAGVATPPGSSSGSSSGSATVRSRKNGMIKGVDRRKAIKFDMSLGLGERDGAVVGTVEYSRALWNESTVENLMRRYERTLKAVVADPEIKIKEIDLLSREEKDRAIEGWNKTSVQYDRERSVDAYFREQVAQGPERIAITSGSRRMTYGELDAASNRLARWLIARGVGPETQVGVCLRRSPELIVGLLGILKAGGAYTPLDASYPVERLALMVEDAGMKLILTEESLKGQLPAQGPEPGPEQRVEVAILERLREELEGESDGPVESRAMGGNLAYVIYTSGSTGRSKGVCIEHRAVARLVKGANYAELGPEEVILQFAPVSFDAATFEIWGALCNGGRLALAPAETISLDELAEEVERQGVTTMWLTSALFQQMVEGNVGKLSGVRQLLAGGDTLPVAQVRKALSALPQTRLINGYGPTENTTFTTTSEVDRSDPPEHRVPIGRPISNTQTYILDENQRLVPVGVIGELYTGGEGLGRGYLNRPDLTAERFVPKPFGEKAGERLYRTGDQCRYLEDGRIEFVGRNDHQIKLRGYRIELGEIESALTSHPEVREAVVEARPDRNGEKRLVAYFLRSEGLVEPRALRSYLSEKLPDYMIPSVYVELTEFPVTSNGKIDRRKLPEPDLSVVEEDHVEPRNEIEQAVAEIWADVLGLKKVGVEDNFFELGGHSLMVSRVISRVRDVFQVETPLRDLYQNPTVAHMARLIEAMYESQQTEMDEIASVLDRLEGLAQEEVDALLHQMSLAE